MTRTQIDELIAKWGCSMGDLITILVDRQYQQENPVMNTTFDTIDEAYAAGFTHAHKGGNVKDTSGPNEFGYSFTQFDDDGKPTAEAVAVWLRKDRNKMGKEGCIVMMFPPTA